MNTEVPKWIKKFQRISWEPEILISGGLLFTLFEAQSALIHVKNYLYPLHAPGQSVIIGIFAIGISALTLGFSFHLITKAFWIALLALKSVFPHGIDFAKLNYSKQFLKKEPNTNTLDSSISKIGTTSSLMFVVSFLFMLIFFGIGTYMILIMGLLYFFPLGNGFNIPILSVVFIPLLFPFIDFITLGLLKKGKIVSKIYYPLYKVISWMTLSFLYRDILYTFISNISKRKLVAFFIFFIVSTVILGYRNIAGYTNRSTSINDWAFFDDGFLSSQTLDERKYENLRNDNTPIVRGTIHSDVIKEKYIKLYLRYLNYMDDQLKILKVQNSNWSTNQIMNDYIHVKVDQIPIDSINWNFTRKSDISQYGIIGYIPIPNLVNGPHIITAYTNEKLLFKASFWK